MPSRNVRSNLCNKSPRRIKNTLLKLKQCFSTRPTTVPATTRSPLESDTEKDSESEENFAPDSLKPSSRRGKRISTATTAKASVRTSVGTTASAGSTLIWGRDSTTDLRDDRMGSMGDARQSSKGKEKATNFEEEEDFDTSKMETIDGQCVSSERTFHDEMQVSMWSSSMSIRTRTMIPDVGSSKSAFENPALLEGWEEMENGYVSRRERCEVTGVWKTVRGVRTWETRNVTREHAEEARGREMGSEGGKHGEEQKRHRPRDSDVSPLDLGRGDGWASE